MACGPQMVGRVVPKPPGGKGPTAGITANRPCVGAGPVPPRDEDRRRARSVGRWVAWAAFALLVAWALVGLLASPSG